MGNKTRTRRTKWRRLSLGDASGPEEEDDETQQHEQQQQQEAEELRKDVVLHSDEKEDSVCVEHDKKSKFAVVVTTTVNNNNNCTTTSSSDGNEEDDTKSAMMVSNHNNQRGPAWKLPASQPVKNTSGGYYNANNGYQSSSGRPAGSSNAAANSNGFRRGGGGTPRYNSFNGNYNNYGRANSWNNTSSNGYANGDHHHHGPGLSKMHGIEKKIFNDEEYTKISTPRQEVLFKKGSIGAKKKLSTTTSAPPASVDSGSEQDSLNGNAASPILAAQGDSPDSFQYSGNDSGSTGDASSTAGESAAPCDAAMAAAAASGAALQAGYADGTPLVCFPMYDFYGGYGGMYPGSMLVQTYPGGPIVAAVPVPMPVQAIDWYGGAAGARGASNGDAATNGGEVGYYYALGYPAGSEVGGSSQLPETSSTSTRRNSLESYQASSQEVMTSSETGSSSENSSPCQSTGPSSQGPASPQGELVSPAIDPKAQTGGGAATAAAAAAVVMDMTMMSNHQQQLDNNLHHHRKMAVAGFVYPYAAYGLAPPALYASGGGSSEQLCDPTKQQLYFYYPDVYYPNAYEQYDEEQGGEEEFEALEEAMDVNADVVATVEEEKVTESVELDKPDEKGEQLEGSESNKRVLEPKETREVAPPPKAVANGSAGTGRRKKRRKKRNKTPMADALERTESLKLGRPIQPLVRVTDDGAAEDEEEDETATAEEETLVTAAKEEDDAKQEEMSLPAASSISLVANDPATPTADSPPHDLLLVEEAVHPPHSSRVEPPTPLLSSPSHSLDSGQQPQSTPDFATSNAPSDGLPDITSNTDALFPPIDAGQQEPSDRGHCLSFEADPAETLESPAFCSTPSFPLFSTTSTSEVVVQLEEKQESKDTTDAAVLFAVQLLSQLLPASSDSVRIQSTSTSRTDSFEQDSLTEGVGEKVEEPTIDRDSLDGEEQPQDASLCDDFVYLHMDDDDDKNEAPDVYFEDDEPQGMVLCDAAPPSLTLCLEQPQLWRTVILEESEPNSKEMSPLLCSDSGIGAGTPSQSPTPNAVETPNEEEAPTGGGPITKAVSRWLESAPIEQQLIASSKSIVFVDNEEEDSEDDDIYYHHQEVEELEEEASNNKTVPKNGVATLRTAPSSDGPALRRVGSDSALASSDSSDDLLPPEEDGAELLTQTCDPAKYSVYYQLGVSVDQDDSGVELVTVGGDPIKSTALDDAPRQCSRSNSSSSLLKSRKNKKNTSAQLDDGKKKKKKRGNSWRRILLLHRAAHNKSKDDAASLSSDDRRLKSGSQSCCALQ